MKELTDNLYYGCTMSGDDVHIIDRKSNKTLCGLKRQYFFRKTIEDGMCETCNRIYNKETMGWYNNPNI